MRRTRLRVQSEHFTQLASFPLGLLLLAPSLPVDAACDYTTPSSGQTVTCSTAAPNPSATAVTAFAGSTKVTVNVQQGAELDVNGSNGILVYDQSTVTNLGTLRVTGDTFNGIAAQGTGAGLDILINRGLIVTSGDDGVGMFNSAAAVTMLNDTAGVLQTSGNTAHAMADSSSAGGGSLTTTASSRPRVTTPPAWPR